MKTVFERIACYTASYIDKLTAECKELAKNYHDNYYDIDTLVNCATETVKDAVSTILIDDNNYRDDVIDLLDSIEYESYASLNNMIVLYTCGNISSDLENYHIMVLLHSYTELLKAVSNFHCPSRVTNKDNVLFIINNEAATLNDISLPLRMTWCGLPIEQRHFMVNYKDMFSFKFSSEDEFEFIKDVCVMRDFCHSLGAVADSCESGIMMRFVERYIEKNQCDPYDVATEDFIDVLISDKRYSEIIEKCELKRL